MTKSDRLRVGNLSKEFEVYFHGNVDFETFYLGADRTSVTFAANLIIILARLQTVTVVYLVPADAFIRSRSLSFLYLTGQRQPCLIPHLHQLTLYFSDTFVI